MPIASFTSLERLSWADATASVSLRKQGSLTAGLAALSDISNHGLTIFSAETEPRHGTAVARVAQCHDPRAQSF